MSTDRMIHLGVYVKITKLPKVPVVAEIPSSNYKCNKDKPCGKKFSPGVNFCNDCGAKIEPKIIKEKIDVNIYELIDEYGDMKKDHFFDFVHSANNGMDRILLPTKSGTSWLFDFDDDAEKENAIGDKEKQIATFNKKYAKVLKFLTDKGFKFQIKYGLIMYYA